MTALQTLDARQPPADAGYVAPTCDVDGAALSSLHAAPGFDVWMVVADLGAGASLQWSSRHGDEAIFVAEGELQLGMERVGTGSAVVVESGVTATARAVTGTRLVHFGSLPPEPPVDGPLGAPATEGHATHVVGPEGIASAEREIDGAMFRASFFADSRCPTCRLTLMRNSADPGSIVASHLHSQDELIYVLSGDMQLGRLRLEAGMAVAIPRDQRYGLRTQNGFDFLNYRRDASYFTGRPGSEPILETGAAFERSSR